MADMLLKFDFIEIFANRLHFYELF